MLTPQGCAERRARLWKALPEPADALVLSDPKSLIYFANFAPSPFVFRSCDASGFLVLTPEKATLYADTMSRPFVEQAHVDEVVVAPWYDGKHSPAQRRLNLFKAVNPPLAGRRFGVEAATTPALIGDAHAFPLEEIVRDLRRVKNDDEMALLRRSVQAGEAGHAAAPERAAGDDRNGGLSAR